MKKILPMVTSAFFSILLILGSCSDSFQYTVGGNVKGLNGTLILQVNGDNPLTITKNGTFSSSAKLADGSLYSVTISTQPTGQTCEVDNGKGTINGENISNIKITCVDNPPDGPRSTLVSITPLTGTASGGTGFILTGTHLTGTTAVRFGGSAATNVTVVDASTVTGVTPAKTAGAANIVITTSLGDATLTNGYTYIVTAVGESSSGGAIACLGGGLNDFVAAFADNSSGTTWGAFGTATGAQSFTDGAANTTTIVTVLGANGGTPYPAQICSDYEIDSQGNSPCQIGNACYNDWFSPAVDQLNCLYNNQVAIGGFVGTGYWTSTENSSTPTDDAYLQFFDDGTQGYTTKHGGSYRTRCIRAFTP